jgi:prophage regulatory protein
MFHTLSRRANMADKAHSVSQQLPTAGYVRLPTVLAVFPVSRSAWWAGIKNGRYPAGVKLGPRTTAWRVEQIRALLETAATKA